MTRDLSQRAFLESVFRSAVAAAEPGRLVRSRISADGRGVALRRDEGAVDLAWDRVRDVYLVGGGKAGRAMAEPLLSMFGKRIRAGIVAVPAADAGRDGPVRFVAAEHPVPGEGSVAAGRGMAELLARAGEPDLVVALLSGGGSAMIAAPADGLTLPDKAAAVRALLRAGADIASFNAVRKHLSRVKGGLLARAAAPAAAWLLLLSDVPGDDPSVVASGPFTPDPTTFADAREAARALGVLEELPASVRRRLAAGAAGEIPETPKRGDPAFARVASVPVGSNGTALSAAAEHARALGADEVETLPGFLSGEARDCAAAFAARLRRAAAALSPGRTAVLVAGGETTVRVAGGGRGGRCQEFALSAARSLDGSGGVAVLCAGTDGIDGPTGAAGGFADGTTAARAAARGLSVPASLAENDAYALLSALGDLVVTGPTGTNVADIAVGVAEAPSG